MKSSGISKKELKNIQTKFKDIDALFLALEKDKSLPTFGEFFVLCMLLGNTENVNLKEMYPVLYKKINLYYSKHIASSPK